MNDHDQAGDALAKLDYQVAYINERLNYLLSYVSAIGTWGSTLVAILAVIITLGAIAASVFSFSGWRNTKRITEKLSRSVEDISNLRREVEGNERNATKLIQDSVKKMSEDFEKFKVGLSQEFERKIRLVRSTVSGEINYSNGNFEVAYENYRTASEEDPNNIDILFQLGRTLTYLNKFSLAVSTFTRLNNLAGGDPRGFRGLALAERFENVHDAHTHIDKAIELAKSAPESTAMLINLYNDKALFCRDGGNYNDCRRFHMDALQLDRRNTITIYFVGVAKILCGDTDDGRRHIKRADANADSDRDAREIRPMWADVIKASEKFLEMGTFSEEEINQVCKRWDSSNSYLSKTIRSHFESIRKGMGSTLANSDAHLPKRERPSAERAESQ